MSPDDVILTVFALVGRPQQSGATRGHIAAHRPTVPSGLVLCQWPSSVNDGTDPRNLRTEVCYWYTTPET